MPPDVTWYTKLWNIIKPLLFGGGTKIDLSHAKNVIVINNPQCSGPITVSQSGDIVTLNVAAFPNRGAELAPVFREALNDPDGFILEESAFSRIQSIQSHEDSAETKEEIDFFRQILPPADVTILRACLYLKKIHDENIHHVEVARLKSQISRLHGKRGTNMANLCTAGYFKSWIRPLYEEFSRIEGDKTDALKKFQKVYHTIVEELPWTVFAAQTMSEYELEKQIAYKLDKIKSYGTDFLNIHALSKSNVSKVRSVIPHIEEQFPNIRTSVREEGASIIVRLRINPDPKDA